MNLTRTDYHPKSRFDLLTEHARGKRHLHMLSIRNEHLRGIETLAELKALGKRHYHRLCGYLHPDTEARQRGHPPRAAGQTFESATVAYHWLMGLTERDVVRMEKGRRQKRVKDERGRSTRGSISILSGTVYDYPLPWHFSPIRDYGYGYQESFEHILWQ